MIRYFKTLFSSSYYAMDEALNCISRRVSEAQNMDLLHHVTKSEIKFMLDSMYLNKAPGPDRMDPTFYKTF